MRFAARIAKALAFVALAVGVVAVLLGATSLALAPKPMGSSDTFARARGADERVIVVRAERAGAAASVAQVLVQRLRHELEADVWSARGAERGFFAMRWPLWVLASDLTELESEFARALATDTAPSLATWFERVGRAHLRDAERLARFSQEFPGTEDASSVVVVARTRNAQPWDGEHLAQTVASERASHPDVSVDIVDPLFGNVSSFESRTNIAIANGALWGGSFPVIAVARSAAEASAIARRLREEHADVFASVRTLSDEVPDDQTSRAAVALRVQQLSRAPGVSRWPAEVREVLRARPIFPSLRPFTVDDLPAFVRDGYAPETPERVVVALPHESLRPNRHEDVARVRAALAPCENRAALGGVFVAQEQATFRLGPITWAQGSFRANVRLPRTLLESAQPAHDAANVAPQVHAIEVVPTLSGRVALYVEGDLEGHAEVGLFGPFRVRVGLRASEALKARAPLVAARVPDVVNVVCSTRGCSAETN